MTTTSRARPPAAGGSGFVGIAGLCLAMGVGGFAPTYWLQLPGQTVIGPPLLHLHAALFTAWLVLLLAQAALAARGRLDHHRAWGVAAVSLATAMVAVGVATAAASLRHGLAAGFGDAARGFLIVPLSALAGFAVCFAAALLNVQRPERHKRLLVVATAFLLGAAMARPFFLMTHGFAPGGRPGLGPPPSIALTVVPTLLADLPIVVGMLLDARRGAGGRAVWLMGLAATMIVSVARIPLAQTPAWRAFADALAGFAG